MKGSMPADVGYVEKMCVCRKSRVNRNILGKQDGIYTYAVTEVINREKKIPQLGVSCKIFVFPIPDLDIFYLRYWIF